MASASQYAEWLQGNQDQKGSDLYNRTIEAYKMARTSEVSEPEEASEEPYDPYTTKNIIGSAVEPLMTLGSGMFAGPVSGLAGLGAMGTKALGLTEKEPADVVRGVGEAMTYQPRTGGGQIATEAITYPFRKFAEGADYVGGEVSEKTGSPAVGAVTNAMLQLAPAAVGYKGGRGLQQPTQAAPIPKAIASKISNLLPRHRKRAGAALNEVAGSDYAAIVNALENAQPGVSGVRPTAGQAAVPVGSREFAAVQKTLGGRQPTKYERIVEDQQAGRVDALREGIARTPEELAIAKTERKAQTDPLYKQAREDVTPIDVEPVVSNIDKLIADNPGNARLLTELNKVRKGLVDEDGLVRTNSQEIISSIDGLKSLIADKDNAFIRGNLTNIKNDLRDSVPQYKAADKLFKELSKPVNQMEIGAELIRTLEPRLGSKERAVQFANAIENAKLTVKRASTGKPRFDKLEDVLSPEQMKIINDVRADLSRDVTLSQQAIKGTKKMQEDMDVALTPAEYPPMLSTKAMIIRKIMARMRGDATKKTMDYLANFADNPQEIARIMREANPAERAMITKYMEMRNPAIVGGAVSAAENQ